MQETGQQTLREFRETIELIGGLAMARQTVDTKTVRDRLGDLLDRARYRGDEFVIARRGRPVAALIPYDTFERFQRARREALRVFEQIREANAQVDPQQVSRDVDRAVAEVRRNRRQPKPSG